MSSDEGKPAHTQSETTAPTAISSFAGMPASDDETSTTGTETETVNESGVGGGTSRETESDWEGAR